MMEGHSPCHRSEGIQSPSVWLLGCPGQLQLGNNTEKNPLSVRVFSLQSSLEDPLAGGEAVAQQAVFEAPLLSGVCMAQPHSSVPHKGKGKGRKAENLEP